MPLITDLNATNGSYVLQYVPYTDFNLWIVILISSILFLVFSRYINYHDDVGKIICAVIAMILSFAASFGSLSVAHLSFATSAISKIENSSLINSTTIIEYNYVYPVKEVITANWLTIACVIFSIIAVINMADMVITTIQNIRRDKVDDNRFY